MKHIKLMGLLMMTTTVSSWGATCSAQGWKISTSVHHQPSRVAGNTLVFVEDPSGKVALSFSATSFYAGKKPPKGVYDSYEIETVWEDELGVASMSWSREEVYCPRCWPEIPFQNEIVITTAKKTISCRGGL